MKDLTSTTFGLVIAYLLPGFFGLITISFWSATVREQFEAFSKAQSNVGLFFVVVLVALLLGVELTAVRWVLFELWFCRKDRLRPEEFAGFKDEKKASGFRVAIDEHYRYHQFWGGLTPILPAFFVGLTSTQRVPVRSSLGFFTWALCVILEVITIAAGINAYIRYVMRARAILKEA